MQNIKKYFNTFYRFKPNFRIDMRYFLYIYIYKRKQTILLSDGETKETTII